MLGQIVLDNNVRFLSRIGAVRLHDEELSLTELSFTCSVIKAADVVGVVSYFEAFLQTLRHFD